MRPDKAGFSAAAVYAGCTRFVFVESFTVVELHNSLDVHGHLHSALAREWHHPDTVAVLFPTVRDHHWQLWVAATRRGEVWCADSSCRPGCRPSDRRLGRQSCRHPVTRMPHISHLFSSHLHDCFREAGFGTATFINLGSEQQEDQSNDCGLFVLRNVSLLLAAGSQIPWTIPRGGARAPRLADLCAGRPAVSGADMRAGPAAVRVSEVDIWVRREMERLFLINFLGHPSLPLHPFGRQPGAGLHRLLVRLCGAHGITPTMDALVAGLCNPLLYPPASRGHRRYDPNG